MRGGHGFTLSVDPKVVDEVGKDTQVRVTMSNAVGRWEIPESDIKFRYFSCWFLDDDPDCSGSATTKNDGGEAPGVNRPIPGQM